MLYHFRRIVPPSVPVAETNAHGMRIRQLWWTHNTRYDTQKRLIENIAFWKPREGISWIVELDELKATLELWTTYMYTFQETHKIVREPHRTRGYGLVIGLTFRLREIIYDLGVYEIISRHSAQSDETDGLQSAY